MGRFLTYEVPLFADFRDFMKGNKPYNKTIFSVVDKEEKIKKVCGDLSSPGTGVFFTLPVDYIKGLIKEVE